MGSKLWKGSRIGHMESSSDRNPKLHKQLKLRMTFHGCHKGGWCLGFCQLIIVYSLPQKGLWPGLKLLSAVKVIPGGVDRKKLVHAEKDTFPLQRSANPIMGTPPSWPNLTLITSQSSYLQMPSYWGLAFERTDLKGCTNIWSITKGFWIEYHNTVS